MSIMTKLKFLSFLQFFIWGSWLITLGSYMIKTLSFTGTEVGNIYSMQGIAACIMPLLLGIIADKYIAANQLFSICHFIGGIMLLIMTQVTEPSTMLWVMLFNFMVYMPTLGLINAIAHYHIKQNNLETVKHFPTFRVFGTFGFIIAMWVVSLAKFELSSNQLYIAAAASFILSAYSLFLPKLPVALAAKDENGELIAKKSLASRMGLDALVLLKQPRMAIFFCFAMLLGVVLHITNVFGNPFLHDLAALPGANSNILLHYPDILYSLSQISEIIFILAIPFFLKKFGIKVVMLLSVAAWTLRFAFFSFGDPSIMGTGLIILSMVVYGCAFDFFMISGSIFIEKEVDSSVRAGAQGLFMTSVNGLGTFIGMYIGGRIIDYFTTDGMRNWENIWLIFAAYTALIFVVFLFAFKDKKGGMAVK